MIRMFTDGACSSNPGPGGYAAVINLPEDNICISGYEENTTNNRMELKGVIYGLKKVLEIIYQENNDVKELEIFSDSAYVINAINQHWISKWKLNGFKNAKKEPIKNVDLWNDLEKLIEEFKFINVTLCFKKVKGHNGNYFNEMADSLARNEIVKNRKQV